MTQSLNDLLADMRRQVEYSDKITMPVPLYERMKTAITTMGDASVRKDGERGSYSAVALHPSPTTDMSNDLRPTEQAYVALLKLPTTDEWRALNQDIYARLRDEIASDWQWDAEHIQEWGEVIAAGKAKEVPDTEIEQLAISRIATWLYQQYDKEYDAKYVPVDTWQSQAKEIWGLVGHYPKLEQGEIPVNNSKISKEWCLNMAAREDGGDISAGIPLEQRGEISVHPALAAAAEILANFKTEGNKLEEWQACYAKLFTQMNDICNQKRELVEDDNYQGAMAEIYEIVRVARDNPTGLKEFLMINFPEEWGLSKMQHKQLLSGASLSEIEGGKP